MTAQNFFESSCSANRSLAKSLEFDAPAEDDMETGIDLNEQLIINRPATFFMRVIVKKWRLNSCVNLYN